MRPDPVGPKVLYFNPSSDKLSTANLAAIDSVHATDTVQPYAYTATVRDDYDAFNFLTDDAASNLVTDRRVAFGLFLSPQNDLKSFMFQLYGKACFLVGGTNVTPKGSFFFGRKATNNTVTSDKASANNTLAKWIYLPSIHTSDRLGTGNRVYTDEINTELFSYELSGGFVYCFGFMMDNNGAADISLKGGVSLAFRKYSTVIQEFSPTGGV